MEALKIIVVIFAVLAVAGGITYVICYFKDDDPPFNPKTIGISFVCHVLFAVGVYLGLRAGFTDNTFAVLGCGILVYLGLLVYVARRSNILTAIWTVTSLAVLSTVVVVVLLGIYLKVRDGHRDRDRIIDAHRRTRTQEIGYEQDSC